MPESSHPTLLGPLLETWDRSHTILVGLLSALPQGGLEARTTEGSPSIAELFAHIHFVRLAAVYENDPTLAEAHPDGVPADENEWRAEPNPSRLSEMLNGSAAVVRGAVEGWLTPADPDLSTLLKRYDHPMFLLQHLLWHEAYHVGQMKLALKAAGLPMSDQEAGPLTWGMWWRRK